MMGSGYLAEIVTLSELDRRKGAVLIRCREMVLWARIDSGYIPRLSTSGFVKILALSAVQRKAVPPAAPF